VLNITDNKCQSTQPQLTAAKIRCGNTGATGPSRFATWDLAALVRRRRKLKMWFTLCNMHNIAGAAFLISDVQMVE
jgi:hypothetical protein